MKKYLYSIFLLSVNWILANAQTPTSVSGRVVSYLSNRIGDYDGLRVRTATGEVSISFPPHAAAPIRRLVSVGQPLTADVEPKPGSPGPIRPLPGNSAEGGKAEATNYRLIRLRNEKAAVVFQLADWPPPMPQSGHLIQSEGPLLGKMHDDRGRLTALLTDKYLIDLKPHQSEQVGSLVAEVQRLGFSGFERSIEGFVNRTGRTVLHPTTLTIRGQTFAL